MITWVIISFITRLRASFVESFCFSLVAALPSRLLLGDPLCSIFQKMSGNFQDWTPVTLQKTSPGGRRVAKEQEINKARRAGDAVETEKKCAQDANAHLFGFVSGILRSFFAVCLEFCSSVSQIPQVLACKRAGLPVDSLCGPCRTKWQGPFLHLSLVFFLFVSVLGGQNRTTKANLIPK